MGQPLAGALTFFYRPYSNLKNLGHFPFIKSLPHFVSETEGWGPQDPADESMFEALLIAPAPWSPRQKGNSVFLKTCVSGFVRVSDPSLHGAEWTQSRVSEFLGPRHDDLHLNRRKIN